MRGLNIKGKPLGIGLPSMSGSARVHNPVGPVEEMLVNQIVTAQWRLRRALRAETGEIALSPWTGGHWARSRGDPKLPGQCLWHLAGDPVHAM